jgi:sarcosine oxidase subunit beta
MQTADVAIIGGGVIGCSIAYHLAEAGVKNGIIFERRHIASGATGICPGGIRQQFEGEAECKLARSSMKFFEQANEILQPEFPFFLERSGYLFLAESEDLLSRFRRNVSMQNALGIRSRLVSCADIQEIVPALVRDRIAGGSFCADDGFLEDCDGFTHALVRCARNKGFRLVLQEVTTLRHSRTEWQIETSTGRWTAGQVVIAAGTDSVALSRCAGIQLPIRMERRRLGYTESQHSGMMNPLVIALERSFAGKQLRNGVFYVGWLAETAESDDMTFAEQALEAGTSLLPAMANFAVRRIVTGYYDSTPDQRPILGAQSGVPGLYVATGFSGHGFMLAPAVGAIMADLIVGSAVNPVLTEFSLERFATNTSKEGLQI